MGFFWVAVYLLIVVWFVEPAGGAGTVYSWVLTSAPTKQWTAVAANNIGTYFVAAATFVNTTFQGGLYISADGGSTWVLSSADPTLQWSSVAVCNDAQYMIAGAKFNGIYVSQDRGNTWTLKYSDSGTTLPGVAISYSGIAQYGIDGLGRVLQSTDYGNTFTVIYSFSPIYTIGYSIACDYNAYRVVAGLQFGVYYSNDGGGNWTQEWITADGTMPAVGASTYGTSFIAAQYTATGANPVGGVLVSTSNGSSWSYKLNSANILTAALGGSGQFMAYASNHTVYVSDDYGSSFTSSLTNNNGNFQAMGFAQQANSIAVVQQTGGVYIGKIVNTAIPTTAPTILSTASPTVISDMPTRQPTVKAGGGTTSGDDEVVLVSVAKVDGLADLFLAILPGLLLIWAGVMVRYLRWNGFPEETSALRPPFYEAMDIAMKCSTWFFFVLNLSSTPTDKSNPGNVILVLSKIPSALVWLMIVFSIFAPRSADKHDPSNPPTRTMSGISEDTIFQPKNIMLRHYLHTPSLKQRSWGTTRNSTWYTCIVIISMLDIGLISYLPWKRTEFSRMSRGYPNLFTIRTCLYAGLASCFLQSIGSIALYFTSQNIVSKLLYIIFSIICMVRAAMDVGMLLMVFNQLLKKETQLIKNSLYDSVDRPDRINIELQNEKTKDEDQSSDDDEEEGKEDYAINPLQQEDFTKYLYMSKHKHVDETNEVLRRQLKKLGVLPLEYIALQDIKAELAGIFHMINQNQPYDEARLDYLLLCMELNPQYQKEKEELARLWRKQIKSFLKKSLKVMRGFVSPDIFIISEKTLMEQYGYSPQLAKRIMTKKCLWLVRMHSTDIERLHEAELIGRFSPEAQHLDIVELAAIFAVLPEKFSKDPFDRKTQWRLRIEDNLKKMLQLKREGKLAANLLRNSVYAGQKDMFANRHTLFQMQAVSGADAFQPRTSHFKLKGNSVEVSIASRDESTFGVGKRDLSEVSTRQQSDAVEVVVTYSTPEEEVPVVSVQEIKQKKLTPGVSSVALHLALMKRQQRLSNHEDS